VYVVIFRWSLANPAQELRRNNCGDRDRGLSDERILMSFLPTFNVGCSEAPAKSKAELALSCEENDLIIAFSMFIL
jgi:hypothetical protein